ncbi:MAG TPA: hypothetical protein VE029_12670 [Rhizobacter sp.]|nr:hypothetical protein [Rhizobacter sp.]
MSAPQRLHGRHALLTGAGGGTGLAVTQALPAGNEASYITAQTLVVDGGNVMS